VQDLATSSAAPLTAAERELKPAHDNACAVFYSPLLLSQYVEDLKRYTYALRSCHRIEEAINRQKSIFALQDEIAMPGMSAETLRTRATSRDMQRTEALSVDERQEFEDNQTFVISGAEAVRREAQAQFLDREFAERLRDAVLQIEVARETVKRQLFVIKDLAAQECGSGTRIKPLVLDGAWVTKGLPVLSVIKP
jgi:hypothetical protein